MKKNVKCNLLKSLFLIGTVLTVSACKKEENIGDGKILKMDNNGLRFLMDNNGLGHLEQQSGKNENNLIKDIDESMNKLETENSSFYFLWELDRLKKKLNEIGNENYKEKIILKLKDKIKFNFEKNFDGEINFSCGKVLCKDISRYSICFLEYCKVAKAVMDLVGLEDNYKIDLSKFDFVNHSFDLVDFDSLKENYKRYLADNVISFDVDVDGNVLVGWNGESKVCKPNDHFIEMFFEIYDLNQSFLDKKFDFKQVRLEDILYLGGDEYFLADFIFKEKFKQKSIKVRVPGLVKCLDLAWFNLLNYKVVFFDSSDRKVGEVSYEHLKNFLKLINGKIKINAVKIFLEEKCFSIGNNKQTFYVSFLKDKASGYLERLNALKAFKSFGMVEIEDAKLTVDKSRFQINNFNFLEFSWCTETQREYLMDKISNKKGDVDLPDNEYLMSLFDVCNNLIKIFDIFNINCSVNLVEKSGKQVICLSSDDGYYYFKLNEGNFLVEFNS